MKKMKLFLNIAFSLGLIVGFTACEPKEMDRPDVAGAPQPGQTSFTVTKTDTSAFWYVVKNTSAITGIAHWNLNGTKKDGQSVLMYAPLPGTYKVYLTLTANGGIGSDSASVVATETDWAFLNSPINKLVSGGLSATDGKTWMVDASQTGHYGIGGAMTAPTNWWACPANARPGSMSYDDEMTFKLVGMVATLNNHGQSYVNGGYEGNANFTAKTVFGNNEGFVVDYNPPAATWSLSPDSVLSFSCAAPFWLGFYNGETSYKILKITEEFMIVSGNTPGTGNWWQNMYVRKGYVRPSIAYDTKFVPTTGINEFAVTLENVVYPASGDLTITSWSASFGDGSDAIVSTDTAAVLKHSYLRIGKYPVNISVTYSNGTIKPTSYTANVTANHPDYVPFELNTTILYNDFSEVIVRPFSGENCTVAIVDNPSVINPNRSTKVAHYSKSNQQWANAYMLLGPGYRFNLQTVSTFSIMVYGKAGKKVLLKLENTDMGGDAWTTGTADFIYTIQKDNTWELAQYNFKGHSAGGGNGAHSTTDVTTDATFSKDYYNVVRIMFEPGVGSGDFDFYFDELRGPSVEGIKSLTVQ